MSVQTPDQFESEAALHIFREIDKSPKTTQRPVNSINSTNSKKLTDVYWDTDVDPEQLSRLLKGDIEKAGHIDRANLFRRLLSTYDWYTLLALIPPDRLQEALSDAVLDHLHPASLKDRYRYARHVLYG